MSKRGRVVPKSQPPTKEMLGEGLVSQPPSPRMDVTSSGCFGKVKRFVGASPATETRGFHCRHGARGMLWGLETIQRISQPPSHCPPINTPLSRFNEPLSAQMLTPVMIVEPAEGINSKSPFK